jgi:hypothetical protein
MMRVGVRMRRKVETEVAVAVRMAVRMMRVGVRMRNVEAEVADRKEPLLHARTRFLQPSYSLNRIEP